MKGDGNITFFQTSVLKRRAFNKIRGIQKEDANIIEDLGEMKEIIVEFYKNILPKDQVDNQDVGQELLNNIPTLITEEDNNKLTYPFSYEVYEAISRMGKDKALGTDGFPPKFFHIYWYIMEEDVTRAIHEF